MNGIYSGIFYLTQFSTGSLILSVFSLTFALFFLIGRNRSKATKNMGIAFALLSLFHLAFFTGFSFYHPLAAYHRWITVSVVLFTQIHIILFVIQYPDHRNIKEAVFIKWILYSAALCFAVYYIIGTMNSPLIFVFDGHHWDLNNMEAGVSAGIAIIILGLFSAAIVIWRFIQLKKNELYLMLLITLPFLIGMIVPSVVNVLNR